MQGINRIIETLPLICPRCGKEKKTKKGLYCHSCGATISSKKRARVFEQTRCRIYKEQGNRQYHKLKVSLPSIWKDDA